MFHYIKDIIIGQIDFLATYPNIYLSNKYRLFI